MKHRYKLAESVACGLVLLLLAPHAFGSTTFPEALRKELGLAEIVGPDPGCQLCHQDDLGGLRTATKPLGRSLLIAGAVGGSVPTLLSALKTLEANGTDSDGDEVSDIEELKAGTDPNLDVEDPLPPAEAIPLPQTGCSLAFGAARTDSGVWAACCAVAGLLLLRRRRA